MLRWEVGAVKGLMAAVTSFGAYLAGVVNEVTVILVFAMFLDMITGLLRAYVTKSLNSTLGMAGLIKKFAVFIILALTAAVEYFFIQIGQDTGGWIILGVTSFFLVNEGLSILENAAQLGVPIPPMLYNALEKLNKDPAGKEQMVIRDKTLDKVDKFKLIEENKMLQHQVAKKEETKDEG
ncbi:holin family protein [Planomicrobium sp. YIM 101495]|uniref:phage holin family protein n=1 Tax=Planomicrobium sp. YIM 101495 TaxID=2665160 RepID=UPI0012B953DB|nr:phage holin family protein [Planomicrobium sp. YIM 101495]MTD30144.1 hypothetical protein [Planomicrobium sp. YIM 101495]